MLRLLWYNIVKENMSYIKERKDKMALIHVTKDNYESEIVNSDKKVLLDFWASWCGPCRMIAPTIDEVAAERTDIKVGKVNVDDEPELAKQFGIVSIPTLVVMKDGKVITQSAGVRPKQAIFEMIDAE